MTGGTGPAPAGFGAASHACFEQVLAWLEGNDSATLCHGELEDELQHRGRELLRRLLQDHLSLRAANEQRVLVVADEEGVVHAVVESGHRRALASVFGQVDVDRLAYRHRGHHNLHPADGLSKGEKRSRKRMAEVGAVYDLNPVSRCPADVMTGTADQHPPPPAPKGQEQVGHRQCR